MRFNTAQHATQPRTIIASGSLTFADGFNITASGNISGSSTTSIRIGSSLSAQGDSILGSADTNTHTFRGHVTASGNISASGNLIANNLTLSDDSNSIILPANGAIQWGNIATQQYIAGTDHNIMIDGDNYVNVNADVAINLNTQLVEADGVVQADSLRVTTNITASGNISGSGDLITETRTYDVVKDLSTLSAPYFNGDIVYFGNGPSGVDDDISQGRLYYFDSNGNWEEADADDVASSGQVMLGIAIED